MSLKDKHQLSCKNRQKHALADASVSLASLITEEQVLHLSVSTKKREKIKKNTNRNREQQDHEIVLQNKRPDLAFCDIKVF